MDLQNNSLNTPLCAQVSPLIDHSPNRTSLLWRLILLGDPAAEEQCQLIRLAGRRLGRGIPPCPKSGILERGIPLCQGARGAAEFVFANSQHVGPIEEKSDASAMAILLFRLPAAITA